MWLSKDCLNSLIYWDNPRDSGIAFGSVLVCLLAVRYISLISVMGNLALALVTATMSFRIYKSVLAAVNKTSEGHPFKQYLEYDVNLPSDKVAEMTDSLLTRLNNTLTRLKTVFLVEDIIESIKFAVVMYFLTYIGALVNGLTLVILVWVSLFSIPRVYRDNQKQIDEAILPLKTKLTDMQSKVKAALPAAISKKEE
jgi:ABC-type multidrug transport system fused ATPase/permease subunit